VWIPSSRCAERWGIVNGVYPTMRLVTLPGVFRPRSDSWMLAEVVERTARPGETVLDPFTGSGILAIAAARKGADATAVDLSRRAVLCTGINARLNGVRLRVLLGDALESVAGRRFDLVVANPPYVPSSSAPARGRARAWAAGLDGRRFIDRLCAAAPKHLNPGGRLLLIHSSVCGERRTFERLAEVGLEARVIRRRAGRIGPLMSAALIDRGAGDVTEQLLVFEATAS